MTLLAAPPKEHYEKERSVFAVLDPQSHLGESESDLLLRASSSAPPGACGRFPFLVTDRLDRRGDQRASREGGR
jgi:hypothetical protein